MIGRTLRIDNDAYEIVGVTTPEFRHPSVTLETDVEVWAPSGWITAPFPEPAHGRRFLPAAIARLKPGVTVEAAQARLEALGAELRRSLPRRTIPERTGWTPRVLPLKQDLIASARPSLLIVMAAVVLVLLIGCVNIANLQLARAAARERDVAVRRALGASPARIMREHLAESAADCRCSAVASAWCSRSGRWTWSCSWRPTRCHDDPRSASPGPSSRSTPARRC